MADATPYGFNGAAAFQPRKYGTRKSLAELAADELQWGRGFSAAEIGSPIVRGEVPIDGFNGAAAFQPRKSEHAAQTADRLIGFNGAAAFQPRKLRVSASSDRPRRGLQWGRGFSAAEITACGGGGALLGTGASMGPRLFSRGNMSGRVKSRLQTSRFNGAAAFQPRKYQRRPRHRDRLRAASMGPRLFSRGNSSGPVSGLRSGISFNGAAAFQPRK